jgi:hypothetical protein
MCYRIHPSSARGPLCIVGVYSPAWPIPPAAYRGQDVSDVKLPENREIWVSDLSSRDYATP